MRKSLKKLETLLVAAALMLSATIVSEGQTESIIVSKKHTVRELRGVVLDIYDEPLAGVDVAVFDNAGWIQEGKTGSDVEQRLMAATTTDANGRFNFKHLPAGKYEVRFRLTAFNDIHFLVLVKPHGLRNKKLVVTMKVAT
jgi:protocatechuate 3,4-dioxygenase beta subunit